MDGIENFTVVFSETRTEEEHQRKLKEMLKKVQILGSNVTINEEVRFGENVTLCENTTLSSASSVGSNSLIRNTKLGVESRVGRNCIVGPKEDGISKIGHSVTIGDGCTIYASYICSGATVGDNVFIGRNVVIAAPVIIKNGVKIPRWTIIKNSTQVEELYRKQILLGE